MSLISAHALVSEDVQNCNLDVLLTVSRLYSRICTLSSLDCGKTCVGFRHEFTQLRVANGDVFFSLCLLKACVLIVI